MSQSSGAKDRSTGSGSLLLHVRHPDGQTDEIYLARGLTIGRADHNQIILADQDAVARTHARVELDQDGSYRLRCTAEGGELLGDSGPVQVLHLSPGTCFRIGDTAFECVSGRASNVAPATEAKQRCPYCHAAPPTLLPAGQSPCTVCSRLLFGVESSGGQPPWLAPARFGQVTASRFVASGGMGVVLQGARAETGQPVAIKLIRHDRHARAAAKDRFAQEIAAMTRLDHDNVVKLLDSGEEAGFDYLVMEWVEGRTLRDVIRSYAVARSVPEFVDVADWFLNIAAALEAIHSLGLIHRDVKPSNILIDQQNLARLTDLGLVRPAVRTTGGMTTTGDAPGTWEYMAPEQASTPDLVTCRADYYSLAVTFYELLTGHRPVGAWQPASKTNPTIPPEFDRILETMLHPDPIRRLDNSANAMERVRDLVAPKWSYRYVARLWLAPVARFAASFAPNWAAQEGASFWNCFEIINESAIPLVDISVTGTVEHQSGAVVAATIPLTIDVPRLGPGEAYRENGVFLARGDTRVGRVQATMQCSRGTGVCIEQQQSSTLRLWGKSLAKARDRSWLSPAAGVLLLCCVLLLVLLFAWGKKEPAAVDPSLSIVPFNATAARGYQEAWSRYLGQPVELTNSVGMKFALLPPGEFLMGSPESESTRESDETQHRVRITKPYYLSVHEVTVGQFRVFVESRSYRTEAERDGNGGYGFDADGRWSLKPEYTWRNVGFSQAADHPVVNISWNDAVTFIEWLSEKEGRRYRLPTEAEREYACRAGTTTAYQHGDDPEGLTQVGNVADGTARAKFSNWIWTIAARDGYVSTAPVGSFRANAFGLHDMHGNVWEWCADWYDNGYYANSPVDDPSGPTSGSFRVYRGGSWYDTARLCRSASRDRNRPSYRSITLGFRLASSWVDASGR